MAEATFEQFQEWLKSQQGNAPLPAPTRDEVPPVTIADVLCALVNSARLPDESTVIAYQKVIRDHFTPESTADSEAVSE